MHVMNPARACCRHLLGSLHYLRTSLIEKQLVLMLMSRHDGNSIMLMTSRAALASRQEK